MDTFSKKSEYKYSCAKCIYNTNNICNYNKHLLTPKHKNTDNSGKSEHKYSCSCCHYNASDKYDYNKHLLTQKHITNYTFYTNNNTLSEKSEYTYSCSCCKYHTNILCNYNKHLLTAKHLQQATKESLPDSQPQQESDSQKPEPNWPEIIQMLVKENQEQLNFMVTQHNTIVDQNNNLAEKTNSIVEQNKALTEQNKTLTELVKNQQPTIATNNSHNNNNNQNYNINMFLSDKCKDAQNLSEFIEVLKTKVDMMKIGQAGYVNGISKLFIDELNAMEVTERPLHCTDERRSTFYVHNDDAWKKDENLKDTKTAISNVSRVNLQQCFDWSKHTPEDEDDRNDHVTRSIQFCKEAVKSSHDKHVDKIIKNISKEIPLNKQVICDIVL